jgi:arginine:ornithine antiporter/lysine permease
MMNAAGDKSSTLSVPVLTALVVGSMVGGGIFSLPQTISSRAGVIGASFAWAICGAGMLTLALVFQSLAVRKPDLNAGVFAYAKAGFGEYVGFLSALGYWAAACLGNVSFLVLYKSTLGAVIPAYGAGNTPAAIATTSILLWCIHYLLLRGVQQAAIVNVVTTIAKVAGVAVFLVITAWAFDLDVFRTNLWGDAKLDLGSVRAQVASAMYVAVFVLLGVESASTYSRYARERSHVGIATISGFLLVLVLVVAVTMFSFGVLPQVELAGLRNPSTALVLKSIVGPWGAYFVSIALIVSLLGAFLSWTLVAAEVLYVAAQKDSMPRFLGRQNRNKAPAAALWLTNGLVQAFLVLTLFAKSAYQLLLDMTSSMAIVPYLLVAGYAMKLATTRETYGTESSGRTRDLIVAALGVLFSLHLLYVGGMKYLLLSSIIYAPGVVLFVIAKRERSEQIFRRGEQAICATLVIAAAVAVYALVTGSLSL